MIDYKIAGVDDIDEVMDIRLEMLRVVNNLPKDFEFTQEFVKASEDFFLNSNQTTILANDKETIGCATICYVDVMPTFDHQGGHRAHIMNVYCNLAYRRQGIAKRMMEILVEEAKSRAVTEISLDATEMGRKLYEAVGFHSSSEAMVINI